jgi:hypothetical protein
MSFRRRCHFLLLPCSMIPMRPSRICGESIPSKRKLTRGSALARGLGRCGLGPLSRKSVRLADTLFGLVDHDRVVLRWQLAVAKVAKGFKPPTTRAGSGARSSVRVRSEKGSKTARNPRKIHQAMWPAVATRIGSRRSVVKSCYRQTRASQPDS